MSTVRSEFTMTECADKLQEDLSAARAIKDPKKELQAINDAILRYQKCIRTTSPEVSEPPDALLRDLATVEASIAAIRGEGEPRPRSSSQVTYTDPEGRVAYSQYDDGPVYSNGEALPNVAADRVTVKTTGATYTQTSDWTKPPWAGWERVYSRTY